MKIFRIRIKKLQYVYNGIHKCLLRYMFITHRHEATNV